MVSYNFLNEASSISAIKEEYLEDETILNKEVIQEFKN